MTRFNYLMQFFKRVVSISRLTNSCFLLAIFTIVTLPVKLLAQDNESLIFRQLSTADGLSQNTVRTILIDTKGFLWAGTLDGLNRFDGNHFIVHKPLLGINIPLSDHRIREVLEDRKGFIWVRKYDNSFSCYNPASESFIELLYNGSKVPLPYTNLIETSGGYTWLWDATTGCAKIYYPEGSLPRVGVVANQANSLLTNHSVQFIFEDSQANLWIGTANGLNRYLNNSFEGFFRNENQPKSFTRALEVGGIVYFITTQNYIYRFCNESDDFLAPLVLDNDLNFTNGAITHEDEILLTTLNHGLVTYNLSTNTLNHNPFPNNSPLEGAANIFVDSREDVWVFDHSGILRHYMPAKREFRELNLIPPGIISVIDYERYVVFIDSRGDYWITTYGNGLFRYDPVTGSLENFRYNARSNSPSSNFLLSIAEDQSGNIWIGSEYAGIIQVVRQNFTIKWVHPNVSEAFGTGNNVKAVLEDSRGNIWVGVKNGALYLYNYKLQKSRKIRGIVNPYTIIEDDLNRIWIGTKGHGVYVYDITGNQRLYHFRNEPSNPNSLSHNSVFSILQDKDRRIWVGTFGGGLNRLTRNGNEIGFTRYFHNQGNKSFIRHLFQDKDGTIWTGSYDGLIGFKPDELLLDPNSFTHYFFDTNNIDGLNCNDIKTIHEDKTGSLWIGTAGGGLNKMERGGDNITRFVKYTTRQGLPSDVVNDILECRNGVLWVSTENGISRFNKTHNTFRTYRFADHPQGNFYNENASTLLTNGTMLWGTLDGLIQFNPALFVDNSHVPPVIFTDLYLHDERVVTGMEASPLGKSISVASKLELSHKQNTFTIHFASLNLTEPGLNKYSYMLEPYDKGWSQPSNSSFVTYKNLPPGTYRLKVKGANADGFWSQQISEIEITVTPPFWQSNSAMAIYIVIMIGLFIIIFMVIFKISNLNNAVRVEKELTDYKLRFFTNISHEFKTPLTLIKGAVEVLAVDRNLTESGKKQVAMLTRNARQMTRLIDQLLEFRKIQNNKIELNMEMTDISRYLQNIYSAFKETAYAKNITYTISTILDNNNIYIDQDKVEKIIFNLLSNAFKFTPENGTIKLSAKNGSQGNTLIISVIDSGIGIPKEKQHLLFSRFMQINFSSGGTGVGLSLVKEFSEAHQGRVWYEPNPEGGAIFSVELPGDKSAYPTANLIDEQVAVAEKPSTNGLEHTVEQEDASTGTNPSGTYKILVIDDNKDIRDFLTDQLGEQFDVLTADNGISGLEMAFTNNPDLIVCDVKMPGIDGIEVTTRLKSEFQTSHIPVILLTALSSDAIRLKGSECGADAYIMKPFSLKYLISRIQKLIEQREKLKKRFSIDIEVNESPLSQGQKDKEFYQLVNAILDQNIDNHNFSVEEFTKACGQKRTLFFKKIKGLTGYSPNDLIKIKRMKRAAELLLEGKHTVAEVSWMVGIEDQFYFSKCFKSQFGCSPSKYSHNIKDKLLSS